MGSFWVISKIIFEITEKFSDRCLEIFTMSDVPEEEMFFDANDKDSPLSQNTLIRSQGVEKRIAGFFIGSRFYFRNRLT